jgi:serralysin
MAYVYGTDDGELLEGTDGADYIYGYGGTDYLRGSGGPDYLNGGEGNDFANYWYSGVGVVVSLATGIGHGGEAEGDTLAGIESLQGSNHADTLSGDDNVNLLFGEGGNDILNGGGGADNLWGLADHDTLAGGMGADYLNGGAGLDTASYWDSPVGVVVSLATGAGEWGTAEGDTLAGIENLEGSMHGDTLSGDGGANVLTGRDGVDNLSGGGAIDTLFGGNQNDVLTGGSGADYLSGGNGTDWATYYGSPEGVTVSLITNSTHGGDAEGDTLVQIENIIGSVHDDTLWGHDGVNVLDGAAGDDWLKGFGGADHLFGYEASDTLWGGDGDDLLLGGNGADTLRGENDSDWLDGGGGADTMFGGAGNDTYIVDSSGDVVTEYGGQGLDTVRTGMSWVLPAGADVETLRTTNDAGTTMINLTGNAGGNQIIGNDGTNIINGGPSYDQMIGRNGDDIYYVDHASDSVTEYGGQGSDTVRASVSWTLTAGADVEHLHTTANAGMDAINLTGNETDSEVTGNNGSNILNGGEGNDELTGRGGQDAFLFATALGAGNIDVITDFNVADDTIRLDQTIFSSSLGLGTLAGSQFVIGPAASDANHRIIYDDLTGAVYYDSDGTGATAAIQFAAVSTGLALANFDFFVVV